MASAIRETDGQREVIGACLLEPARVVPNMIHAGVQPDWFNLNPARLIWESLAELHATGHAIDPTLVMDHLRKRNKLDEAGGASELERMIGSCVTAAHADYYLDIVRDRWIASAVAAAALQFREEQDAGAEVAAEGLIRAVRNVLEKGTGGRECDKRALMEAKMRQWEWMSEQRFKNKNTRLCLGTPLPWACLNKIYMGLRPGLHIVAARTSVGKTVVGMNYSQFWCEQNIPHGFVSLDMKDDEMLSRYLAAGARVSLRKLEWGANHDEIKAVRAQVDPIAKSCMHMTTIRDVDRLHAWVSMGKQRWGMQVLVVDYIQLMRFKGDNRMPRHERVSECVLRLKEMANREGIPVVALCQLSREIDRAQREDVYAEPTLADLAESSEIEKAASTVTMLFRDRQVEEAWSLYAPKALAYGDEHLAGMLRALWLKIEKNQQGVSGVRRPFIMYPNQFIIRPGMYGIRDRQTMMSTDIRTGKQKQTSGYWEQFGAIRDDWRVLPEDDKLAEAGVLGNRECGEME